ncbi:Spo0B domain-containing protein [Aneurinibacillus sp. Ricciae_BoGa-3]|uniref:Spo0B domain-containing protein n=1 Tax=Aneurinibacillus sp. Ricciae_BoGa-3 TaxID=3022697 RepID=UPI00234283BD|nr:Spo0B domain-containing protein [Aneurinibacillus sp. Ricciae_BoGa-3]WCK53632.1 Spo0B domain-containing protein [Aneurinibacillus sp. Ricciae_BoGa-3]
MNDLVEVLKYQRHDFMNHMQVLLGYLKLEKYTECEAYIQFLVEQAARESIISQLDYPKLTSFLLSFNAKYSEVELEVEISEPFNLHQVTDNIVFLGDFIIALVLLYQKYAADNGGEPNKLELVLSLIQGALVITTDYDGRLSAEKIYQELFHLFHTASDRGAVCRVEIHTDTESVVECRFPLAAHLKN